MSIASLSGHLTLSPDFQWIATFPALLAFALATVLEIAGYYIPWVDHILDVVAAPAAIIAGVVAMASTVTGMSPFLRWALAVIAGGGLAGTVQVFTSITRLASSAATAGLGNPAVSTVEAGGSVALSIAAIAMPLVALAVVVTVLVFLHRLRRKLIQKRPASNP
jgi:hypothetical protein